MASVDTELLRQVPFLAGASPEGLEWLAGVVYERDVWPGQVIVQEGSSGREMYLILEGLVEVIKGEDETLVAHRGPGDLIGEMSFLEARPRFATVRALESTRLLEMPEAAMHSLLTEQPHLLYRLVTMLSARLRTNDLQMIADLQRKNKQLSDAYEELKSAQAALVEKERLERELELARELQLSILPADFPVFPGVRCAAHAHPARQVGGDFYDVIPFEDGRIGLVMADVSGKGMAAALFMALTRSLLRAEARRCPSPREVLLNTHRLLLEISRADIFVTVFYGVLDPVRGTLLYARAGHDRPLLLRSGSHECHWLEAAGMFLGFVEQVELEEAQETLAPGDTLILYTDGMTDAQSPGGRFFGADRLRQAVCTSGTENAQEMCDLVFQEATAFQAGAEQFDDMALLVVKLEATPG